jgi:ferrochelatase
MSAGPYDALLLVSFGGPEGPDEVLPFLENVLRGRNVPRERMLEVAEHYQHFGGVSPLNAQNRALIAAVEKELAHRGVDLPIYWGNRNWHPFLADALRQMAADGVRRALAFFTSAYSSYSGCRQYRENIAQAQQEVGPEAPAIDKLRVFFNHPGFIEPMAEHVQEALSAIPADRRDGARLIYTAHSIPMSMAAHCQYEAQVREASRLVSERVGAANWEVAWQSRSGPPSQPWLEPDILDTLKRLAAERSAHMEVIYDLDCEAAELARQLGLNLVRAKTVGTHPRFVRMVCELIEERITDSPVRLALGPMGPSHDVCPADCCQYSPRRPGG